VIPKRQADHHAEMPVKVPRLMLNQLLFIIEGAES
jgi:hypothetical protein